MNSAFEDCCALLTALAEHKEDTGSAFRIYEQTRREDTDVLCELSKANFVELRKRVQSPWFIARKRLDMVFNRLWPQSWLPLYTMIAHTTIPYATALARARRQERILIGSALFIVVAISIIVTLAFWLRL